MRVTRYIPIALIDVDRFPLSAAVLPFLDHLRSFPMAKFPPIHVARLRSGRFKICDGRHRLLAHKLFGDHKIQARYSERFMKTNAEIRFPAFLKEILRDPLNGTTDDGPSITNWIFRPLDLLGQTMRLEEYTRGTKFINTLEGNLGSRDLLDKIHAEFVAEQEAARFKKKYGGNANG